MGSGRKRKPSSDECYCEVVTPSAKRHCPADSEPQELGQSIPWRLDHLQQLSAPCPALVTDQQFQHELHASDPYPHQQRNAQHTQPQYQQQEGWQDLNQCANASSGFVRYTSNKCLLPLPNMDDLSRDKLLEANALLRALHFERLARSQQQEQQSASSVMFTARQYVPIPLQ